jgi:prepilin-type N-terminal cleavage/methylation domain-containing protein/prepilin-type processing-associated H-X9-DG protein
MNPEVCSACASIPEIVRASNPSPTRADRSAFTLIELLVVIAVIAVLSSIALPSLARAKDRTHGASCLNNLRQWGLGTLLFADANDDHLPRDGTPNGTSTDEGWYIDLPRTLGIAAYHSQPWRTNASVRPTHSIWICPANKRRSNGNNLFHYSLNSHINGDGAGRQVRLASIPRPTQTVWLFDNGRLAAVAQQNNVHTNLHSRGAQFTFLDGHAARFRNKDYWDFARNRGITNHPGLVWIP